MNYRTAVQLTTVAAGALLAIPVALALAGVVLPGDPDDPNRRALLFALASAALVPFLAVPVAWNGLRHLPPGRRGAYGWRLASVTAVASSMLLLLLAVVIAAATPPPETPEQARAATLDPHLWVGGAWRMSAVALILAVAGGLIFRRAPPLFHSPSRSARMQAVGRGTNGDRG